MKETSKTLLEVVTQKIPESHNEIDKIAKDLIISFNPKWENEDQRDYWYEASLSYFSVVLKMLSKYYSNFSILHAVILIFEDHEKVLNFVKKDPSVYSLLKSVIPNEESFIPGAVANTTQMALNNLMVANLEKEPKEEFFNIALKEVKGIFS